MLRALAFALVTACATALALFNLGPFGFYSPGIVFGALLARYLHTRCGVRSGLGEFVGICVGAYLVSYAMTAALVLLTPSLPHQGFWAPNPAALVLPGMFGAAVVSGAFLMHVPGSTGGWHTTAEIMTAPVVGGVLALGGAILDHQYGSLFVATILIWQTGMALLLASLAESRSHARFNPQSVPQA